MSLQRNRPTFPGEEATLETSLVSDTRLRRPSIDSPTERPHTPRAMADSSEQHTLPAPRRGRKPGPLSKSARDVQRRLNHSIIEKARRTKINDALATLKRLVPPDYLQVEQSVINATKEELEGDEDDEDDYGDNVKRADKQKPKAKKEKEFKLEILVRTVAFLEDLLQKVNDLEANTQPSLGAVICQACGDKIDGRRKRKISDVDRAHDNKEAEAIDLEPSPPSTRTKFARLGDIQVPRNPRPSQGVRASTGHTESLPSISSESWLDAPDAPIINHPSALPSYLPSPPASTHLHPVRTAIQVPPLLSLGPRATSVMSVDGHDATLRTPEDETAASMLLHMALSPPFRPISISSSASHAWLSGVNRTPTF